MVGGSEAAGAVGSRERRLTEAEARVISVSLANPAAGERERLRLSGLPRSTYHAARRRAYAEGWLQDRYVPAPGLFGYPEITVAVARPFADAAGVLRERWSTEPGGVLLWSGPQFALGMFLHPHRAAREAATARLADPELTGAATLLHPPATPEGFPVFFDFEGAWAHLIGQEGIRGYPTPIPSVPEGDGPGLGPVWNPRTRWAARELLRRPFLTAGWARPGHLVGPFGLPLAQQRLIGSGWLRHRVLLRAGAVPPYRGRSLDRLLLLLGTLTEAEAAERLFQRLTHEAPAYPFLFVRDGSRLLLGLLGAPRSAAAPALPAGPVRRTPLTEILQGSLRAIESFEAPLAQIRPVLDFRYDRIEPPPAPEPPAVPSARAPGGRRSIRKS